MIQAILASLWFYLFPLLTGRAILGWMKKERSAWILLEYFIVGALVLYALAFGIQKAGLLTITALLPTFVTINCIVLALNAVLLIRENPFKIITRHGIQQWIIPLVFISGLTGIAFTLWHWNIPGESTLNWDIFEHQTLVNLIRNGHFSFTASRISDTFQFDGYSTMFHWLLAIPQTLFAPPPLTFWWTIEGFHLFLSIAAVYIVAFTVSKNRFSATVAAIIGAFSFESYVAYASLFLVPQTFTAVIFALGLGYFLQHSKELVGESKDHHVLPVWFFPVLFVFLILNHYIVGAGAISVIMGCFILWLLLSKWPRIYPFWLIVAPMIVYAALSTLGARINVASINGGEATQYLYTAAKLADFMKVFFGYALVALLPFGILTSFYRKERTLQILTVAGAVVCAVVLSGIPYALKFYVLGHYLLTVVAAIGVCFWIRPTFLRVTKLIILTILLLWFGTHLVLNAVYWKNDLHYGQITTHVSTYEIAAAEFLKQRYGRTNTLLISEPATQYILESLSGVDSQGGAYMKQETRTVVGSLFTIPDAMVLSNTVYAIRDHDQSGQPDTVLLVFSGRLFQWIDAGTARQADVSYNIWAPVPLSPVQRSKIQIAIEHYSLKTIYENADMVIAEIPYSIDLYK